MSHFPIAVLHRKNQSIDLMLAPYDEYLEVEPYVFLTHEEAIEKAKKYKKEIEEDQYETLGHIKQMFFNANTDEELFQAYLKYCDRNLVDEDGNVLSTYNPDSKYDYYTEGGRSLFTKDGEEPMEIDCRPSDAIAVAIRVDAPIYVSANVLATGAVSTDPSKDEEEAQEFKSFVQNLKPSDFEKLLKGHEESDQ